MAASSAAPLRKVLLRVETRVVGTDLFAAVSVAGDPHTAQGGSAVLELFHYHRQKVVHRRRIAQLLPGGAREVRFPLAGVPSGTLLFRATFTDRHGLPAEAEVLQDKTPAKTWWAGSAEGIATTVPPPWTPLTVERRGGVIAANCWGRRYEFGGPSIIRSIRSKQKELLDSPARFVAVVDGRRVSWSEDMQRCAARARDCVVLERTLRAGSLVCRMRADVEFDGMLRVDCRFDTSAPRVLDALALEIPLVAECAKYLYRFPGEWGSSENARALPAEGVAIGFHPFLWLGDEERGLAWFCESQRNWFADAAHPSVEIVRRGRTVLLRLNLVSAPVRLVPARGRAAEEHTGLGTGPASVKGGLAYTFGLQATPVKPVEKDAWDHRTFCFDIDACLHEKKTPLQFDPAQLDTLAAAGVRTVVIFESWNDIEAHAVTRHKARLRKLVSACHARGMQALLYFGFLISDLAPEWRDLGKECLVLPKGGYPVLHNRPQPDQSAWRVCLQSLWQDHVAAGIARVMEEFDVDGVYLDGTEYPFACVNLLHGCGVAKPDGNVAPTWPIFAVRSAMRRIYSAVLSRKPQGQVNVHNSTCMTIPTLGWATSFWDGEQFGAIARGADLDRLLPLDAFRAEFMGRPWGVPGEFLCYGKPFTYRQAWAPALLHDVPVRPFVVKPDLDLASSVWKVMEAFGRREAEWLPYWRNSRYVSAAPDGIRASLYRHPAKGVLAVVANLRPRPVAAKVRLDMPRLGLPREGTTVFDALTRRGFPLRDGTFSLRLAAWDWKLVRCCSNKANR